MCFKLDEFPVEMQVPLEGEYLNCCQSLILFYLLVKLTRVRWRKFSQWEDYLMREGMEDSPRSVSSYELELQKYQGWVYLQVIFLPSLHDLA